MTRMQKIMAMDNSIRQHAGRIALISAGVVLFCIAYWPTFIWLNQRVWAADSFYSHAYLIPLVSGSLIWMQRKELAECEKGSSWLGLVLIVGALLVHILSVLAFVNFSSGFSILPLVAGLSLFLFGVHVTLKIWFPLSYLVFMIPMPDAALGAVSVPMKLFATKMGAIILDLMGIPIVQLGFKLQFTDATLIVGNPCSGLRSLIALLALGTLFAYLLKASTARKIILAALSMVFAVMSNIMRVTILGLIAEFYGSAAATGLAHDLSGILVFFVALLLFYGAARILERAHE
jgi:exosortase